MGGLAVFLFSVLPFLPDDVPFFQSIRSSLKKSEDFRPSELFFEEEDEDEDEERFEAEGR